MAENQKTITLTEGELEAKIAAAVRAALPAAQAVAATAGVSDDVKELFSELVLQMTEVNQQGQPKTKISPEEARKRQAATDKAWTLIHAARERGDKPEYKLIAPVYLNERLVIPYIRAEGKGGKVTQREIVWTGMPSNGMLPTNKVAKDIYAAFKESIGSSISLGRVVGPHKNATQTDDRPYVMTPGGLVVKGDPDRKANATASEHPFADALEMDTPAHDNNDPNSEFVNVLGTVAKPLRRSGAGIEAAR